MDSWPQEGKERVRQTEGVALMCVYTPPAVKWVAGGKLLCNTGRSAWGSVVTSGGGMGGGGRVKGEELNVYIKLMDVEQKPTQHGKALSSD